jgi:alpha-D-ribose 1-methylphosphonate 5-triphosphate synthase subunit PhnG
MLSAVWMAASLAVAPAAAPRTLLVVSADNNEAVRTALAGQLDVLSRQETMDTLAAAEQLGLHCGAEDVDCYHRVAELSGIERVLVVVNATAKSGERFMFKDATSRRDVLVARSELLERRQAVAALVGTGTVAAPTAVAPVTATVAAPADTWTRSDTLWAASIASLSLAAVGAVGITVVNRDYPPADGAKVNATDLAATQKLTIALLALTVSLAVAGGVLWGIAE